MVAKSMASYLSGWETSHRCVALIEVLKWDVVVDPLGRQYGACGNVFLY